MANPVATYAALLSTLSFLMALPLTIESYRRHRRERGRLQVEHAEAGFVFQLGGFRYENIILTLINVGTPTVSVTGYELRVYEGRFNILFRRNPVVYVGDGWRVPGGAESFTLSLADGMSPPLAVKSGEPIRLEIHTTPLWPDRLARRVVAVVRFSHARKALRIAIKPDLHNYTDAKGVEEVTRQTLSVIERDHTQGGVENLYAPGIRKSRWWY